MNGVAATGVAALMQRDAVNASAPHSNGAVGAHQIIFIYSSENKLVGVEKVPVGRTTGESG